MLKAVLGQSGKASLRKWYLNWNHLNELLLGGKAEEIVPDRNYQVQSHWDVSGLQVM